MDYKEANNVLRELDKKYHLLKHGQFNFKEAADFYEFAQTGKCGDVEAFPFNELPLETQKKLKDELKVFNNREGFLAKDGEELFAADTYLCAAKAPGYQDERVAKKVILANSVGPNWESGIGIFPDLTKTLDWQYRTKRSGKGKDMVDLDEIFKGFDRTINERVDALQTGKDKQVTEDNLNAKLKNLGLKKAKIKDLSLKEKSTLDKILTAGELVAPAIGSAAVARKLIMDDENSNSQPNLASKSGKDR